MSGKNGGEVDFTGQEGYDANPGSETQESEVREGQGGVKINFLRPQGKHNGGSGTTRVIAPGSVLGSNGK